MEQIPCDPEFRGTELCAVYRKIGRCFMDVHHKFHPRKDYKKPYEREFRNLDENLIRECRNYHNIEHTVFDPPIKPDLDFMKDVLQRIKDGTIPRPDPGAEAEPPRTDG